MSAALARRDEGCASDLLMDRWLLGEIPGSDEGRRLERHVRECQGCAARFQALRSLYGNKPAPKAVAPLPPLSAPPAVLPPEHAVVLQVVILRDGLLVGTEVFTAGRYTVGSDPSCGLRLDDLVPLHAAVSLSGERVALEAAGAPVFVNGFRATACELRPIDEVAVGPYVLRARVISERWQRPKLEIVRPLEPPAARAQRPASLKLELFWGDTRLSVQIVERPADLREFGIESVEPIDGGWMLDGLRVAHGESARFHVGHLVCVATSVPRVRPVPPGSPRDWPWHVMALAAGLFAAVLALGVYGANLEPADFTPKPIDPAIVHVVMKPKPAQPAQLAQVKPDAVRRPPAKCCRSNKPQRVPQLPVALEQPLRDVLKSFDNIKGSKGGKKQSLLAGIGANALLGAPGFGFHSDTIGTGIGAKGFSGVGGMKAGGIGKGRVQGTVSASGREAKVPPTSSLSRDAIVKVINEHLQEITACYERSMMRSGAFGGRMLLDWSISPAGAVTSARIKQTDIKNGEFGACVLGRLKLWPFPRAPGPSQVTFPLLLDHHDF